MVRPRKFHCVPGILLKRDIVKARVLIGFGVRLSRAAESKGFQERIDKVVIPAHGERLCKLIRLGEIRFEQIRL
jgi:hypothetical protein